MSGPSGPLSDDDLELLREAAEAEFHATPPTVIALLDLIEDLRRQRDTAMALVRELRARMGDDDD